MFKVEQRPVASQKMRYLAPLISLVLTVLTVYLLFWCLGKNPLEGLKVFFINPFKDAYSISELLLKSTPLMLIAVGLAVGFRASVWNIGAEGQYIMGAVFATGLVIYFPNLPIWVMLPGMALAGILGGSLWAAVPAFFRTKFHANEILVSLMLVYVAQFFASWLVYGPWRDPNGYNFPQTVLFGDNALLPILIQGTRLNIAFPIALGILVLGYIFLYKSHLGYQLKISGKAESAARFAGFSSHIMTWIGLTISGASAGLAGMVEVAGPVGQLTEHVSSKYGFAAIIVAFVGRLHPLGIFFASILLALIYIGGEQAQQHMGLPSAIGMVFQGLLLFYLLACDLFIYYRITFKT